MMKDFQLKEQYFTAPIALSSRISGCLGLEAAAVLGSGGQQQVATE